MKDLVGIGKLADSKLVNKVYDDAAAPAIRELGYAGGDIAKALRLFTLPIQLAATAQDRLVVWLEQARRNVPPRKQVEAPPQIAGPALRALMFMEPENPMAEMFINLLSKAINKDTQTSVHPGFVKVLEQISPDEALLLKILYAEDHLGVQRIINIYDSSVIKTSTKTSFDQTAFTDPDSIIMYFEHLEALCLVQKVTMGKLTGDPEEDERIKNLRWFVLSDFGIRFLSVCGQTTSIRKSRIDTPQEKQL